MPKKTTNLDLPIHPAFANAEDKSPEGLIIEKLDRIIFLLEAMLIRIESIDRKTLETTTSKLRSLQSR